MVACYDFFAFSGAQEMERFTLDYCANPEHFSDDAMLAIGGIADNPMYIRAYEKFILCWRCAQVIAGDAP